MSKKIKFRAWNKEERCMIYNVQDTYDYRCGNNGALAESFKEVLEDTDRYDVMQFIGQPDNYNKDIYEGDIVRQYADSDEYGTDLYFRYLIRWNNNDMCFEGVSITNKGIDNNDTYCGSDLCDLEIIGNMYENPELLNCSIETIGYADESGLQSAT